MMRYSYQKNLIAILIVFVVSVFYGSLKLSGQDILQKLRQEIAALQNSPGTKMEFDRFADNIHSVGKTLNSDQLRMLAEQYDISRPFELFCLFELTRPLPQLLVPIDLAREDNESVARNVCMRIASDVKFREYYMHYVGWTNQLRLQTTIEDDDAQWRIGWLKGALPVLLGPLKNNNIWDHRLALAIVSDQFSMPQWLDELRSMENPRAWRMELLVHLSSHRFSVNGTKYVVEQLGDIVYGDMRNLTQLPPIRPKDRPFPIEDELLTKYLGHFPNGVTMIRRGLRSKGTSDEKDRSPK